MYLSMHLCLWTDPSPLFSNLNNMSSFLTATGHHQQLFVSAQNSIVTVKQPPLFKWVLLQLCPLEEMATLKIAVGVVI